MNERPPEQLASQLNASCFCMTLDRALLCDKIQAVSGDADFCRAHVLTRPHLFSNVPVFLPAPAIAGMQAIVSAIEEVARLPAYRERVMSWAPAIARTDHGPSGAFMGYDFHLDETGPRLIEVNTNAGGGILNALLAEAQHACCVEMETGLPGPSREDFRLAFVAMFRNEWRLQRGDRPLRRIAIVDDQPEGQYLYPEFVLAQRLFERAGIETVIAEPERLALSGGVLACDGKAIDLVYNRLVDFAFEQPEHGAIREAYQSGAVVITPNPHNHALLADKRNLTLLSDPAALAELGVPPTARASLASLPRTVLVTSGNAEDLWRRRKHLFFKPTRGHGSKAVYRGDKVTRGVWQEIVQGGYVAQDFATPSERMVRIDGQQERRKMDVRLYTYEGRLMLAAARLYQGQATNFRTPGGGFAPVFAV